MNHLFNVVVGVICLYGLYAIGEQVVDIIRMKIHKAKAPAKQAAADKWTAEYEARLKAEKEEREKEVKK